MLTELALLLGAGHARRRYTVRACLRDGASWRGKDAIDYLSGLGPAVEIIEGCDLFVEVRFLDCQSGPCPCAASIFGTQIRLIGGRFRSPGALFRSFFGQFRLIFVDFCEWQGSYDAAFEGAVAVVVQKRLSGPTFEMVLH